MSTLRCPQCQAILRLPPVTGTQTAVRCGTCGATVPLRRSRPAPIPEARPVDEEDERYHPEGRVTRSGPSPWLWIGLGAGALCLVGLLAVAGLVCFWAFAPARSNGVGEEEQAAVGGQPGQRMGRGLLEGGEPLRYRWNGGGRFNYSVRIEAQKADGPDIQEGNCLLSVAPGRTDRGNQPREGRGTGTAFVVQSAGYLVTCAHVVEEATKIEVAIAGRSYPANVVAVDHGRDLAIIHIDAKNLPELALADSEAVEVGQEVRAIGYPLSSLLGDSIKATRGTISGIEPRKGMKILQVDASINPGNSGGPLVNENGDVVGVISAKLFGNAVSNVGFAVPVNAVKQQLKGHNVKFASAAGQGKLDGPALVKKVGASTALVTVTIGPGAKIAASDSYTLTARPQLTKQDERLRPGGRFGPGGPGGRGGLPGGIGGPFGPGMPAIPRFPDPLAPQEQCVVTIDPFGNIEKISGQANLPYLLGQAGTLFVESLSPDGDNAWQDSSAITIEETNRGGGFPFGPRLMPRFGPRGGFPGLPGAGDDKVIRRLEAEELIKYRLGKRDGDTIVIHKSYELKTAGPRPELSLTGDGQIIFDLKAGMPRSLDWRLTLAVNSATGNAKIPLTVTYKLLEGKNESVAENPSKPPVEPAKPAAPPPAPPAETKPEQPAPGEIARLLDELKSANATVRQRAANRLFRLIPNERRDEVARALEELTNDSNGWPRNAAIEALGVWGRSESVPKLIALVEHQDLWARKAAMGALGRLKDPRAADSLAQRLKHLSDRHDASQALRAIGSGAEKAVSAILDQGDVFTRREACEILKAIGTKDSLPALEAAKTGNNDVFVRHSVEEAIKAIGQRK